MSYVFTAVSTFTTGMSVSMSHSAHRQSGSEWQCLDRIGLHWLFPAALEAAGEAAIGGAEWFTGEAFGDAGGAVSPGTSPQPRVSQCSAPLPGGVAGFPEDEYPLLRRWPRSQQLRAQGSRGAITRREPPLGLPSVPPAVTSGLAGLGVACCSPPLMTRHLLYSRKGEETDARSLSISHRMVGQLGAQVF